MKHSGTKDYGRLTSVATITLLCSGSLCVLLLLYVVYYYGLTGQRNFANRTAIIVYCVLPAVLAALLFASLRLKPSWRISLSLVVLSTGISIYAANLFLVLFYAKLTAYRTANRTLWFKQDDLPVIEQVAKEHGVEFDTRSKFDIINELHTKGIEAVPSVIPVGLLKPQKDGMFRSVIMINGAEALPLGGISNRVTVMCNESGWYETYESDEHGFHNPKGIWSSSQIDVVALGDSFTQGHCVSPDRNFVALIRKQYPNTLNLGMNGQGPLIMLATLKEYVQPLNPKLVLWFFWEGNDITDLDKERKTPLLMQYLEGTYSQSLLHRQRHIDQALASYIKSEIAAMPANVNNNGQTMRDPSHFVESLITLSHLRQRIGLAWENSSYRELDLTANMDVLHRVLRVAKGSVEAWGGQLYFVYLPDRTRYSDPSNARGFRDRVFLIAENLGIPIIDVDRAFRVKNDPLALFPFRRMGHYNVEGHRTVADSVLQQLAQ